MADKKPADTTSNKNVLTKGSNTGDPHEWVELTRPNGMKSMVRSDLVEAKKALGWGVKADPKVKAEYDKQQKEVSSKYTLNAGLGPVGNTHRVRSRKELDALKAQKALLAAKKAGK